MSYVDFHTKGVDYRIILCAHYVPLNEQIKGLDALVVETSSLDHSTFGPQIISRPELTNYVDYLRDNNIPIYSVDNKGNKNEKLNFFSNFPHFFLPCFAAGYAAKYFGVSDAELIALGTLLAQVLPGIIVGFSGNKKAPAILRKMISLSSLVQQAPRNELRNAIAAAKIKHGVIPRLREKYSDRFQNRPPRVGIIYGAMHAGIKECLESKTRTNLSFALHKFYGRKLFTDQKTLDNVTEYLIDENNYVTWETFKANIF